MIDREVNVSNELQDSVAQCGVTCGEAVRGAVQVQRRESELRRSKKSLSWFIEKFGWWNSWPVDSEATKFV